jgi:hypothetical protein
MNVNRECENLDAYLADDLSPDAAANFALHAHSCEACREAIDQQCWIDELLASPQLTQLESPSAAFSVSLKSTLAQSRQRAGLIACAFAAAAALLVAAGWAVSAIRNAHVAAVAPAEHSDRVANVVVPESNVVTMPIASVIGDSSTFVVPVESPYPNVTIVRIYPTDQSFYAANVNSRLPSTGDGIAWPNSTNGDK